MRARDFDREYDRIAALLAAARALRVAMNDPNWPPYMADARVNLPCDAWKIEAKLPKGLVIC